ncbi:hypothetical protein NBO_204g0002 [Nosema bombycis CQ1]|uniref:Uncharacterized protein n=1 Tax=Nosema bombycis (strain CQ1 / CVCC 102059) TaxID=578461 RepID=R0KQR5_NOSB1|nr:hypothetical protein NBO_204g0002 [Nosema bombycis CQ1]|eukprot:EOB13081.1 hypothetical protein NBO_204g0002 [Nosema bombycis CQ1]
MHLLMMFVQSVFLTRPHCILKLDVLYKNDPILLQDLNDTQFIYNLLYEERIMSDIEIKNYLSDFDVYKVKDYPNKLIAYLEAQRTYYTKKRNWYNFLNWKKMIDVVWIFTYWTTEAENETGTLDEQFLIQSFLDLKSKYYPKKDFLIVFALDPERDKFIFLYRFLNKIGFRNGDYFTRFKNDMDFISKFNELKTTREATLSKSPAKGSKLFLLCGEFSKLQLIDYLAEIELFKEGCILKNKLLGIKN